MNITGQISGSAWGNSSDGGASRDGNLPLTGNVLNIQSTGKVGVEACGAQDTTTLIATEYCTVQIALALYFCE
ncbi:hypothetical protein FACS189443_6740 [Planctomycetales bacterium]|nr:hypothetical protein FACS189443_6740 [Planctomycetales bacterium]